MKLLIFAGGTGTRLWPLSRTKLPKQFKKLFGGKSTLQLAFERIQPTFGTHNIYICTNENFVSLVKDELPTLPATNIVGEPVKRDTAPSIGYNLMRLKKLGYSGPTAILWADHLMTNVDDFLHILKMGEKLVIEDPKRLVFVGEKPRYAENNLGWIHTGREFIPGVREFIEWKYRPAVEDCKKMFDSGEWRWNPGYFIVDIDYVLSLYKQHAPEMYAGLEKIAEHVGTVTEGKALEEIYPTLEAVDWDSKIVEKVPSSSAVVIESDMNWSDPGTLYALKEALIGKNEKNYSQGTVSAYETTDSVLINEEKDKVLAAVGLEGMVVVNTQDALLVVHKDHVREVSKLVKELEKDSALQKYI